MAAPKVAPEPVRTPDVAVVIQRGHVLYQDGASYEQGQVVEVTAAEAALLVTDGSATRAGKGAK